MRARIGMYIPSKACEKGVGQAFSGRGRVRERKLACLYPRRCEKKASDKLLEDKGGYERENRHVYTLEGEINFKQATDKLLEDKGG